MLYEFEGTNINVEEVGGALLFKISDVIKALDSKNCNLFESKSLKAISSDALIRTSAFKYRSKSGRYKNINALYLTISNLYFELNNRSTRFSYLGKLFLDKISKDFKDYFDKTLPKKILNMFSKATRHELTNFNTLSGIYSYNGKVLKYMVKMYVHNKQNHLGTFTDFFEACCVRKSAENKKAKGLPIK